MGDAITLPGTIYSLFRRCSPVLYPVSPRVRTPGRRGIFIGYDLDSDAVMIADIGGGAATWWPAREVLLDLEDATGRAHAAWWLAEAVRTEHNRYTMAMAFPGLWWRMPWNKRADSWRYRSFSCIEHFTDRQPPRSEAIKPEHVVPSLATLDPDDPRTLPDGSRRVDAEALRRVVMHVAGLATAPPPAP